MQDARYEHKVRRFRELFFDSSGRPKTFVHGAVTVQVHLLLYTRDANRVPAGHKEHWFDDPEAIGQLLL